MGLGPSRLTYDMPPPPPLTPSDEDLDLSSNTSNLQDRMADPEGYKMCHSVAIREGIYGSIAAMGAMGLSVFLVKRYATSMPTVQALLRYSPGVLFLVTSSGLATAAWFTEVTLHDCTVQRGIFLQRYYESIGYHAIEEPQADPNREKKVKWNVKRKYTEQTAPVTNLESAAASTASTDGKPPVPL